MRFSTILALSALITMGYISIVQDFTVRRQRSTIRQYLGIEHGEHDGPKLRKQSPRLIVPPRYQASDN